jgi:ACS family glucarate transporter-like MFS transporter
MPAQASFPVASAPSGRHYRRGWIALFLFALTMINYIDRISLSFAAKPIASEFHLSSVALGYIFSSFLWTYTLFLIPSGMWTDRSGTKFTAGVGIAFWSASTVLTGFAWSFPSLLATRLAMGAGEATSHPAAIRTIREWMPASERGMSTAMFNSGSYAGPALCAVVAGPVIAAFGWRGLFFVAGAIGFVWLAAWLYWFGSPEKVAWLSEPERTKILSERTPATTQTGNSTQGHGLLRLLRTQTLWGLALTQGCNVYSQYLFLTWLPSYLQTSRHLTILKTGMFTAAPYALAVVLIVLMGKLSDRLLRKRGVASGRRRNMIAATMLISSVILLTPIVSNIWMLLGLITISLTGIGATSALNFSLLNDLLPDSRDVSRAMGFLVLGGNTFGLLAPIVTGYVIAGTGSFTWAFIIAGALLVGGATATLTMTRRPMIAVSAVTAAQG